MIAAARMAGADEFVDRLPLSYDTVLEEGACQPLGGQRQRLAIARALLPRRLLDLRRGARARSTPRAKPILQAQPAGDRARPHHADRLPPAVGAGPGQRDPGAGAGPAVDCAPHLVLLERCAIYRHLWQQQNWHVA